MIVQVKFNLKDDPSWNGEFLHPGISPVNGAVELTLPDGTQVSGTAVRQTVLEDGVSLIIDADVPDGSFPPGPLSKIPNTIEGI